MSKFQAKQKVELNLLNMTKASIDKTDSENGEETNDQTLDDHTPVLKKFKLDSTSSVNSVIKSPKNNSFTRHFQECVQLLPSNSTVRLPFIKLSSKSAVLQPKKKRAKKTPKNSKVKKGNFTQQRLTFSKHLKQISTESTVSDTEFKSDNTTSNKEDTTMSKYSTENCEEPNDCTKVESVDTCMDATDLVAGDTLVVTDKACYEMQIRFQQHVEYLADLFQLPVDLCRGVELQAETEDDAGSEYSEIEVDTQENVAVLELVSSALIESSKDLETDFPCEEFVMFLTCDVEEALNDYPNINLTKQHDCSNQVSNNYCFLCSLYNIYIQYIEFKGLSRCVYFESVICSIMSDTTTEYYSKKISNLQVSYSGIMNYLENLPQKIKKKLFDTTYKLLRISVALYLYSQYDILLYWFEQLSIVLEQSGSEEKTLCITRNIILKNLNSFSYHIKIIGNVRRKAGNISQT